MSDIYLSLIFDGNVAMMMAATKTATGVIKPLASESQPVELAYNKCGITSACDENALVVSQLIRKILNKMPQEMEVTGIYVGIMPRSMRGERIEARREFEGKRRVTERDIENLGREIAKKITNSVIAQYGNGFVRDNQETFNVRNELADTVVRKDLAVVVSPRHLSDYASLLPKNVTLRGIIPLQVAIARLVTDEEQRVNGVLSFHIGNQSSGLTYLFNDCVMGTAVVPFGFDHIVRDMTLDKISAENIRSFIVDEKMKYKWNPNTTIRFTSNGPAFSLNDATDAFNARIREIFSLAYDRILACINAEELKVPVLVTSSLVNTPEFAEALSSLLEQDCMLGNASAVLDDDTFSAPKYIPLIALINEAVKPCVSERTVEIQIEEKPVEKPDEKPDEKPVEDEDDRPWYKKVLDQTLRFNDEQ